MSLFKNLTLIPPDAVFGLTAIFQQDSRKEKINLVIGYAKGEDQNTLLFQSVKEAEKQILSQEINKEYFAIEGSKTFLQQITLLVFGESLAKRFNPHLAAAQSTGGTSALYTLGKFILNNLPKKPLYISEPTWANHQGIFENAGFKIAHYPYYDLKKQILCFEKMLKQLRAAPSGSYVLLHASCHNPSGLDLSKEEWKILSQLFLKKKLIPIFDLAYQGLGEGFVEDAYCIRLFAEEGHDLFIAYSCSKNFSLYGERTGAVFILSKEAKKVPAMNSHLKQIIRSTYSNPPIHGALIVQTILMNEKLKSLWEKEVKQCRDRVQKLRKQLKEALENKTGLSYPHITLGKGLFFFTGLKKPQITALRDEYGIYLTLDGRMNITGLHAKNFTKVVEAMASVIKKK